MSPVVTQIGRWYAKMKNEITLASNLIKIIDESRQNALRKVNEELMCYVYTHKSEDIGDV